MLTKAHREKMFQHAKELPVLKLDEAEGFLKILLLASDLTLCLIELEALDRIIGGNPEIPLRERAAELQDDGD